MMRGALRWFSTFRWAIVVLALINAAPLHAQEPNQLSQSTTNATPAEPPKSKEINLLKLATAGGIFMIPIAGMSILAATMACDRLLALRRSRVLPPRFVRGLDRMIETPDGFQPEEAVRLCQRYPSAAANIVGAMLLRVGRPLAEIE